MGMSVKIAFLILSVFCSFGKGVHAYTDQHLTLNFPKGWSENKNMFGMDVIFMSAHVAGKTPLMVLGSTYEKKIAPSEALKFVEKGLKEEYGANKLRILDKGVLKAEAISIYFATGRIVEKGSSEKVFTALIPRKGKYHHFLFQAPSGSFDKGLPLVKNSLKNIKLK